MELFSWRYPWCALINIYCTCDFKVDVRPLVFVTGTDLNCSSSRLERHHLPHYDLSQALPQYSKIFITAVHIRLLRYSQLPVWMCFIVKCCVVLPALSDWSPRWRQTSMPSCSCCKGRSQPDPRPTAPSPPARPFRWVQLLHSASIDTLCTLKVQCVKCFRKPPDSVFDIKGTGRQLTRTKRLNVEKVKGRLLCSHQRSS